MHAITPSDVINAYEVMLGRSPESHVAIQNHLNSAKTPLELARTIAQSREFANRVGIHFDGLSPFAHLHTCIDVRAIIHAYTSRDRVPREGYFVNFLGVIIPTKVTSFLADKAGQLDHVPIPANYHADMAEWGGALRAVDLACGKFTMIELGCGWACWMTNTGVAARGRGLDVDLIGIEGDATHLGYARETLAVNGFDESEYALYEGVAAAEEGFALFPKRAEGSEHWGFAPIFGATLADSNAAVATGKWQSLKNVPLREVVGKRERIDLLHMDIQGGEADLVASTLPLLSQRVRYMLIGTHSRQLEGKLMEMLLAEGWALEVERPAIYGLPEGVPHITVDGVQAWRNPKLF